MNQSPGVREAAFGVRWADRIAGDHGFADVSHTLEIFGTCAGCRQTEPQMKSQTVPSGCT